MVRTSRHVAPLRRVLLAAALAALAACDKKETTPTYPAIVTTATTLATVEGGPDVPFEVSLSVPPSVSVNVVITSADTTEGLVTIPGSGYASTSRTLTFGPENWFVPQAVAIRPVDETTHDGNQTYNVALNVSYTSDPVYQGVPQVDVYVTNADDDVPGFTVGQTAEGTSTSESGTTDTFTVRLNVQPTATVTIPVASTDASEGLVRAPGSSIDVPTAYLTFTTYNWSTAQTVTVRGQPDLVDDGNQTYAINVGPPSGATEYAALGAQSVSVTNLDVDTAGVTVLAAQQPLRTSENGTTVSFTVRLNTQPLADVVVPITSGNAAEGLVSGAGQGPAASVSLTFTEADWATPKTVTLTGQDDSTPSDNVTYAVTVGAPTSTDSAYSTLPAQSVNVLNMDNDVATITVPEIGTTLITSESGTTATFSIVLNKAPTTNVVVPVTANDITEGLVRGGSSPTVPAATISVTFTPADFATPQIVTVVGQADVAVDGNQTHTIAIGPATGDTEYQALPAQSISVTNSDTDVAGYTLSTTSIYHWEGGSTTTFTVRLNTQPAADVVVPVTSNAPAEGVVSGGSLGSAFGSTLNLTFTPGNWQTAQVVSVKGPADNTDDGNQTYTITVGPTSSTDLPYDGLASTTVSALNYDVDTSGFTVAPLSGLVTTEDGGTATFTVRLNTIPLAVVTVPVNTTDQTEATVSGGSGSGTFTNLSFTSSNWNIPQVVTVTGVNDSTLDGTQPWSISVGPTSSGDSQYNNLPAQTVTGSNTDNEVGVSEGTSGAPAAPTALPYSGQVGTGGASYYVLTGITGPVYAELTGVTADVSLAVYQSSSFASGDLLCTSSNVGASASESCFFTAPGTIWVRVSGPSTAGGAGFVLDVSTWFVSTDVPKAIPDGGYTGVTSTLSVSGAPAAISRVIVRLSVTHPYVGDVAVYLVSPGGTEITLSSGNGGSSDNFTNTVFDDTAATSITYGYAPFTGTYRPEEALSNLNGGAPNGTWQLRVADEYSGWGAGTLDSWGIVVW